MIGNDLLALLRCPQTLQPLSLADAALLAEVNASGGDGQVEGGAFLAGLVREDHAVFYPLQDGIPVLLVEQAIPLNQ